MKIKEITIISGKGGTGKTTITASLVPFFFNPVIADCDVDAPDLDILIKPRLIKSERISASRKAKIDTSICLGCGKCQDICRFNAVKVSEGHYLIDPVKCEGCGTCTLVCPVAAIEINPSHTGELYESESDFGPVIHARLSPGEEVSGRLVSLVRQRAKETAEREAREWIIIDGPPGVACNVISSITGTSLVIIVTEPTISGFHDMKRVHETASKIRIKSAIIINKTGLSDEYESLIEDYAASMEIPLLGSIPLSLLMRQSTNRREIASITLKDFPEVDFWPTLVEKIINLL